jgi:ABC-type Mn2+/Zn2+ transport system ATPase subunit
MTAPLVELAGVALGYGGAATLTDISFAVEPGDFLALVGPNGAGKTTLLRGLTGILAPLAGRVTRSRELTIGYVPQEHTLDPVFPLTALDVVLQGRLARLGPWRRVGAADHRLARGALAQAGVAALERRQFAELSGGQKQRVLIARALASEPALIVLDEPTSGTDPAAERALMDLLRGLHQAAGCAIVIATHNLGLVGNCARRIALVDRDRGVFRVGSSAEILTADTLTRLYGREMRVRTLDGWRTILAGGTA